MIPDFTILVALDAEHLQEFRWSYPTWLRYHPGFAHRPLVVLFDDSVKLSDLSPIVARQKVPVAAVNFSLPGDTQREKMLASFVLVGMEHVETPYYLKLDTDTIATAGGDWINPAWFDGEPAFIAPGWNYTKPAIMIDQFNHWAADLPAFAGTAPVRASRVGNIARHKRIISYCMFGNTAWTRECASLCRETMRLPIPSQDTFLVCCAQRLGRLWRAEKMPGWRHVGGGGLRLKAAAKEAMESGEAA